MARKTAAKTDKARARRKPIAADEQSIVDEVEEIGETILSEVRNGVGTVANRVAAAAKTGAESVAESHAGQMLKSLVGEVQEIGEGLLNTVAAQLDRIRGVATREAGWRRYVKSCVMRGNSEQVAFDPGWRSGTRTAMTRVCAGKSNSGYSESYEPLVTEIWQ